MNWSHFNTLLWVRWRITVNHLTKGGWLGAIVLMIVGVATTILSLIAFFFALIVGQQKLGSAPPEVLTYLCDGWILAFLFFWMIGLVNELQRSEMLSIDKLLHLPTTLAEVFFFNFLSSVVTLTTLTFVPPMIGLSIAAVMVKGAAALVMFPLLVSFVLMISALTYQFRGWLATMMQNKRRRQTIIVIVTASFIVLVQVPNLLNMMFQNRLFKSAKNAQADVQEKVALQRQLSAGKITPQQYLKKSTELNEKFAARREAEDQALLKRLNSTLDIVNVALPLGWMAYGAQSAARGNPWPGLAGSLGMGLITAFSLRRSYYTTLRYFTGEGTGLAPTAAATTSTTKDTSAKSSTRSRNWLELSLPWVGEPVAAVAWGTLRSMARAPEVKMLLLGPLFVLFVYGTMIMSQRAGAGMSPIMKSFVPLGILWLSVAGVSQLSHNTFGFDRAGLRAYILSGVPRWQILFGKNLALLPVAALLTVPVLFIVQIFSPVPLTQFAATLLEIPSTLLLLALLGNMCSIYCPICTPGGSMKPTNVKVLTLFVQFLFGLATLFVLAVITTLPVGMELLLRFYGISPLVPVAMLIALVELAASIGLYSLTIREQGKLLQARECRILDVVTQRGE